MAVGGTDKSTYSGATDKMKVFWQGWKWQQKTDKCRRASEGKNDDGNEADKGRTKAAENDGGETASLISIVGSLYCPLSGICLNLRPSRIRLEAEDWELTVLESGLESKLEAAASEEDVEVEDRRRFFRLCRCINSPFTCLRVLAEAALEAEDRCVTGGAVVGGEVGSDRICFHHHISLVRRSGGRRSNMLSHARPNQGDGVFWRWWRRTLLVAAQYIGGGGGFKKGSWRKFWGSVINRG